MLKTGKLIVIDGVDGTGKHTQTLLLKENLQNLGYKVKMISFPQYGKKSAGLVEEYLSGQYGNANEVTAYQASIFYAVDRFDASIDMKKWLQKGYIIICDRYASSNMGHQASKIKDKKAKEHFLNWLFDLEFDIFKIPYPDINILLDLDIHISQKLAQENKSGKFTNNIKGKDIHEKDIQHLKDTNKAFMYVAKKYKWKIIDCSDKKGWIRTRESISKDILNYIISIL